MNTAYSKHFFRLVDMTFALLHSSYDLPEWQVVKVTFFVPCKGYENLSKPVTKYKIRIRAYV